MQLSNEQTGWLRRGLESLAANSHRCFEDALWLGFGDQWWPFREQLVQHDYIEPQRDQSVVITARGRTLLEKLIDHTEVA